MPTWVKKMKFSGDLRLRHDTQWRDEESADGTKKDKYHRNRERFRLRFGFKMDVAENTEVGVRLASGNGFQNTTNQSFDEHARSKEIWIDRGVRQMGTVRILYAYRRKNGEPALYHVTGLGS